mmetsp:Transcript_21140/g.38034  ORF Transcript_21140/g.38034 Transcript_21140/m.38034 type:complete len:88 (+) Transcript_21140:163-426(+)
MPYTPTLCARQSARKKIGSAVQLLNKLSETAKACLGMDGCSCAGWIEVRIRLPTNDIPENTRKNSFGDVTKGAAIKALLKLERLKIV